jgi:hypothetical protein
MNPEDSIAWCFRKNDLGILKIAKHGVLDIMTYESLR